MSQEYVTPAMKTRFLAILALSVLTLTASAQQWAKEVLDKSPRQQQLVAIAAGEHTVNAFVVYPQGDAKAKATVVILLSENSGLTDWTRTVADQLAASGYIAVAPDLLSHLAPPANPGLDAAHQLQSLKTEVLSDLDAIFAYARQLPAANGKVAVAGFDWGGAQAFRYAAHNPDLAAAFIFYGPAPAEAKASIKAPVYAFYAGADDRLTSTVPQTTAEMTAAGKAYDAVTYASAAHGYMRRGMAPGAAEADRRARDQSWERWLQLLKGI